MREKVTVAKISSFCVLDNSSNRRFLQQANTTAAINLVFNFVLHFFDLLKDAFIYDVVLDVHIEFYLARVDKVNILAGVSLLIEKLVVTKICRLKFMYDCTFEFARSVLEKLKLLDDLAMSFGNNLVT